MTLKIPDIVGKADGVCRVSPRAAGLEGSFAVSPHHINPDAIMCQS